jgi:uncharacterized protein YPO0396
MDEDEIDPMQKLAELMRFGRNANEKMRSIAMEEREKGERQIMMDLWGWLGNHTETYQQAFDAVEDYNRALRAVRKKITGRDHDTTIKMCESISAQLKLDVDLYKKMKTASEELEKTMPKL